MTTPDNHDATDPGAATTEIPRVPASSDLLIDMRGITKTFNIGKPSELTVIPGLDFTAAAGEFVSIVGQSGSGKSTLMNIIGPVSYTHLTLPTKRIV